MADSQNGPVSSISACRPLMSELTVEVKVVNSAVVSEVGSKKIMECLVGDATATILFKARGNEAEEITTGRSLRIRGCKVDMYHGSMRLVCGPDAVIEEISGVTAKTGINMSLLEFEAVIVNAYTGKQRGKGENNGENGTNGATAAAFQGGEGEAVLTAAQAFPTIGGDSAPPA